MMDPNPLQPCVAFLYPWKHKKTFRFSDVFKGYRKATPGCNGLKPLLNSTKSFIMFDKGLNTLPMMTVARCWGSISYKTKILFGALAKMIQSTFILDNGSNYKMNDVPKDKNLFLLEKWNRENYGCKMNRHHCVKCVQIQSFFWSVFSRISTEYGEILHIFPYSIRMRENTDQKKIRIWTLFTHEYLWET